MCRTERMVALAHTRAGTVDEDAGAASQGAEPMGAGRATEVMRQPEQRAAARTPR